MAIENLQAHGLGGTGEPPFTASSGTLNIYSCLACRKRKKKCDRIYPCANCQKKGVECIFTARQPSSRQRDGLAAMERLARLEAAVKCHNNQVSTTFSSLDAGALESENTNEVQTSDEHLPGYENKVDSLSQEFGRLAVAGGRSRYVTSLSWANINDELDDLESLLQKSLNEASVSETPFSTSLLRGFGTMRSNLAEFHPVGDMIPVYWHLYKENYDLLVKILHIPTTEPLILHSAANLDNVDAGTETLMFAVYFSVVVTLSPEECLSTLGHTRDNLIVRYKFAMEQALTQARLLETDEFIVLQAFTIYLTALRYRCNLRLIWTMTALAVRLAQNAGIHRDGSHFNLSPFTSEIRRRLWWNIRVIDARAAEDSGYDSAVSPETSDTKMPLNVNDADLSPEMTVLPAARTGYTDMVFSIVRFEATVAFEQLQFVSIGSNGPCGKLHISKALEDKAQALFDYQERLQEMVFVQSDTNNPFYWYTAIVSRIILSKLWLVTYHPYLRLDTCGGLSLEARDELFSKAISIVESQLLLYTGKPTRKWSWLCVTHVQWYAITYILTELCRRTHGERVERAWKAVNSVLQYGSEVVPSSASTSGSEFGPYSRLGELNEDVYQPLNKLLAAARSAKADADSSLPLLASQKPGESRESATNSEGLDLLGLGLGGFSSHQQPDSGSLAPAFDTCQGELHDYIFQDPLLSQIDNETSTWQYW